MTVKTIFDPTAGRARRRKVAAVLAGGLVLGVGTMATLASWNDSEFASATFTAGRFNLEGSLTGDAASFADHLGSVPSPAAGLSFSSPFDNLQPVSETYAGFALRLAPNTSNDATVSITTSLSGVVKGLSYQLVKGLSSTTCTKAAFDSAAGTAGNTLIASSVIGWATGAQSFDMIKGSPITAAGSTVYVCVKVSADASIDQGQVGTGIWTFSAASKAS